jgi:hypothetical protein
VLRRTLLAAGWLGAALVLALGAAGIVAAIDHRPGGTGRPELTATADRAVAGDLEAASADLLALADAVGVLGDEGRAARDADAVAVAIAAGSSQLDAIDAARARLEAAVAAIPLDAPDREMRYSAATIARYDALAGAAAAVEPLRSAWERLTAGVVPALALTGHLLAHDEVAGEAIQLGGAGEYAAAIERLRAATAELDAARAIRDELAATVDVATLDDWIDRTEAYDVAVAALWDALRRSRGRVTDEVRDAAARERAALAGLPPDARALVVILGDVARGGLNQAVIEIEDARGVLLDAVDRVGAVAEP